MAGIVDIQIESNTSKSITELDKVLQKLIEIENKSKIKIGTNDFENIEKEKTKIKERELKKQLTLETDFQRKIMNNIKNTNVNKSAKTSAQIFEQEFKAQETLEQQKLDLINQRIKKASELEAQRIKDKTKIEQQEIKNSTKKTQIELELSRSALQGKLRDEWNLLKTKQSISSKELSEFKKKLDMELALQQGQKKVMQQGLGLSMGLYRGLNSIKQDISTMEKFQDSVLQLGIVGKKSVSEINGLRSELIDLGRTVPRITQEIVDNIITIQRTGKTYEEAMKIIKQASMLAVAGGESVSDATDVLNKVLVAFNIQADNAALAMNSLHTSTINTPLDLKKIDVALRNAGAGMRNFIESTDKSGVALEDYKQRILDTTLSMVGGMTSMGMTASSAGVAVKNLGTKMLVMEKTAAKMFDSDVSGYYIDMEKGTKTALQGLNKMGQGIRLTSDSLSELAQKDAPQAIELMSALYKSGELGIKTLSKLFTLRQAPAIISQLGLINGNMDAFIQKATTGSDVINDYKKSMESWTNQLKLARNNMFGLKEITGDFMENVGGTLLKFFNTSVTELDKLIDSLGFAGSALAVLKDVILALTVSFAGMQIVKMTSDFMGLTGALKQLTFVAKMAEKSTVILAGIAGAIAGITLAVTIYNRVKNAQEEVAQEQIKINKQLKDSIDNLNNTNSLIDLQRKLFAQVAVIDSSSNLEKSYDIIKATVEQTSELVRLLETTKKIELFNIPELKSVNNLQKDFIKNLNLEIEKVNTKTMENQDAKIITFDYKKQRESLVKELEKSKPKILNDIKTLQEGLNRLLDSEGVPIDIAKFQIQKEQIKLKQNSLNAIESLDKEYFDKIKTYYGEDIDLFKMKELEKIKITKDMFKSTKLTNSNFGLISESDIEKLNEARTSFKALSGEIPYFENKNPLIRKEDIESAKEIVDLSKQYSGKTLFEVFSTLDFEKLIKLKEKLNLTTEQELIINKMIVKTQQLQIDNYTNVVNKMDELGTYMEEVQTFVRGFNKSTFEMNIEKKGIKTFKEYQEAMKEFNFSTQETEKDIGALKDIFKTLKLDETISLDKLVETGKMTETLAMMRAFGIASEDLTDSITKLKQAYEIGDIESFKGMLEQDSELQKQVLELYNKNQKELNQKIATSYKDIPEVAILDLSKSIVQLKQDIYKAEVERLKVTLLETKEAKKQKEYDIDRFDLYDMSKIRELELLKAKKEGLGLLKIESDLLKENESLSALRYSNEIDNIKRKLNYQGTEYKELKNKLVLEKTSLETLDLQGNLTEGQSARYKDIQTALGLIEAREKEINDQNISGIENNDKMLKLLKEMEDASNKSLNDSKLQVEIDNEQLNTRKRIIELESGDTDRNEQIEEYKNLLTEKNNLASKGIKITDTEKEKLDEINKTLEGRKTQDEINISNMRELIKLRKEESKFDKENEAIKKKIGNLNKSNYDIQKQEIKDIRGKQQDYIIKYLSDLESISVSEELSSEKKLQMAKESNGYLDLEYEKRKKNLEVQVMQNNLALDNLNTVITMVDSLTGINISGIGSQISGLFKQNAEGSNTFDIAKTATSGLNAENIGAILGIANVGIGIATTAISAIDAMGQARQEKESAKYAKQIELAQKQLDATIEMKNALISYSNQIVNTVSQMATFKNIQQAQQPFDYAKNIIEKTPLKFGDMSWQKYKTNQFGKSINESKNINLDEIFKGNLLNGKDMDFGASLALFNDWKKTGGEAYDYILGLSDDYLGKLLNIGQLDTLNLKVIQDKAKAFRYIKSIVSELDISTQATLKSLSSIDFVSKIDAETQARETAEKIFKPLLDMGVMTQSEFTKSVDGFIDKSMKGFSEISSKAGKLIKDNLSNGINEVEDRLGSLKEVFSTLGKDINTVFIDAIFGNTLNSIDSIIKTFATKITDFKNTFKEAPNGDVMQSGLNDILKGTVSEIINVVQPIINSNIDLVNPIKLAGKELVRNGSDALKVANSLGLSLKDLGVSSNFIYQSYLDGKYTLEEIEPLIGNWLNIQTQLNQLGMSEGQILKDNLKNSKLKYELESDFEKKEEYRLQLKKDEQSLSDYTTSNQREISHLNMSEQDILIDNLRIAKEKYLTDIYDLELKKDKIIAEKALNNYVISNQSEINQLNMSELQILKDNLKIAEEKYLLDISDIGLKNEKLKAEKSLSDYNTSNQSEINRLNMTEGQILEDNLKIAKEKYDKDTSDIGLKNEKLKAEKEYNDYIKEQNNLQNESLRQLGLVYAKEEEIAISNHKQLLAKREALKLEQDSLEKTTKIAENELEIANSEKSLLELAKSRDILYNNINESMLSTNFFLDSQEQIYDNIGSSIGANIRNQLKGTVIQAKYEDRIVQIKTLANEIANLSIQQEKEKASILEKQGSIEDINAKRRLMFMKAEEVKSRLYRGDITAGQAAIEGSALIEELSSSLKMAESLGGTVNWKDLSIDWTQALNTENFTEQIKEKGEALKVLIKQFAKDLNNDEILRLIDEMFGDQAWKMAEISLEDKIDKFIAQFQRLPNSLRDIKREIANFDLWEELKLKNQKSYTEGKRLELEQEKEMFGYTEDKLRILKEQHNLFIAQMKSEKKINELGEINFGTNEEMQKTYENRVTLIEKIESLLVELSQTELDIMNTDKQINDLYKDRGQEYDSMQKSLFDNEQSLIDSYLAYTNIGKTQEEIDKVNLDRLKQKRNIIQDNLKLDEIGIMKLYEHILATDELRKIVDDKSQISQEEYESLLSTNNLTTEQIDLLKEWLSVSGDILQSTKENSSELKNGLIDAFKESLRKENYADATNTLFSYFSESMTNSLIDGLVDNKFKGQIEYLTNQLSMNLQTGFNVSAIQQSANAIQGIQLQAEVERNRFNMLKNMLTFDQKVDYNTGNQVQYSSGSTANNTYNTNIYSNISGMILADNSTAQKVSDVLSDKLLNSFKDKGIDLNKVKNI